VGKKENNLEFIKYLVVWLLLIAIMAIVAHSGKVALSDPEYLKMNETCVDFCEDRGMIYYKVYTAYPNRCYCQECWFFVRGNETYRNCEEEEQFLLEKQGD